MLNIELSERTKKLILVGAVVAAAVGFANIAGLLETFEGDFAVLVAALNSAVAVITAYFTKVKDAVTSPKGE